MRRRDFLKQLGWMTLAAGGAGTGVGLGCTAERRPNLILINVDDLGWTDLGCYGSPYYETPNIDRLCAQGIKFTDAYAAAAVCSPTRSALLTGRYPARTGVTDWLRPRTVRQETIPSPDGGPGRYVDDPDQALLCPARQEQLPPEEETIAEVLREVGYSTAHIGKWHLGHGESLPEHQGFDSNKGGGRYGQTPTYWDPYELSRQKLHGLPSRKVGEYLTDREAAEAVAFINDHRDHPFFLNLWHYAVHTPLHAKEELIRKYENRISDEERKNRPTYAAMLESVDDAVGAVLAALDDLGLAERTLVMLTSDNGGQPAFTEMAPLRGGKGEPYEAGTRVPQIIRWKNRVRPSVSSVPVTSVDIFPTFCDIAGARASQVIDGTSLLPIMDGGRFDSERSLYWHYPHYWNGEPPYSIVRKGRWKLIRRYEPGSTPELYDLVADLGERRNLARVRKATRQLLRADLKAWLDETGALLPLTRPPA